MDSEIGTRNKELLSVLQDPKKAKEKKKKKKVTAHHVFI